MKKIFLTSGVVLSVFCSAAFADTATFGGALENTQENAKNEWCDEGNLGVTSGPAELRALWDARYHQITLNHNTAENGWDGTSNVNPVSVFSIEGESDMFDRSGASDADYDFTERASLSGLPTGATVTLTLDANDGDDDDASVTQPSDVARPFKGFYSSQGAGTQYIDEDGELTGDGETAISGLDDDTIWYAQYNCATFTPANPTRPGYAFDGWAANASDCTTTVANGGTRVTNFCFNGNTTLYACWAANTIAPITWDGAHADSTWTAPTGIAGTNSCIYGGSLTLPTKPTRKGYGFAGWAVVPQQQGGETPSEPQP